MKRLKLAVEKRKILGKNVKKLRRDDILPANIYGKNIKSLAVQVSYKEFEKVYKEAGETRLIDVEIAQDIKPSLIHNLQQDYYNHRILHVDFYQVNLKEKVKTMVPIITQGVARAVADKLGLLLQPLSQIEIEALPTDLPENIEVNVGNLAAVNDQITVKDLKAPTGVAILTKQDQVVVKIGELVSKEAQEQAAAEAQAAEAAKAATAAATPTAEGAKPEATQAPSEGTQPKVAEEKTQSPSPQPQTTTPKSERRPQK
ncbi:MAG: 50S ribosomal protein L25 [Patescibacteria group bacterium]